MSENSTQEHSNPTKATSSLDWILFPRPIKFICPFHKHGDYFFSACIDLVDIIKCNLCFQHIPPNIDTQLKLFPIWIPVASSMSIAREMHIFDLNKTHIADIRQKTNVWVLVTNTPAIYKDINKIVLSDCPYIKKLYLYER